MIWNKHTGGWDKFSPTADFLLLLTVFGTILSLVFAFTQ